MSPAHRSFAAVAALIGWGTVTLQLVLSLQLAEVRGYGIGWALMMYFGYFTILTNILVALAISIPLVAPRSRPGRIFRAAGPSTAIAAAIVIVGVAYHFLLSADWNPQGWHRLTDVLLHYIMPAVYLVHWSWLRHGSELRWRDIPKWTAYPIVYFVYVLLRGVAFGVYPYPFLDVGDLGYGAVILISLVILLGFVVTAMILVAVGRLQARGEAQLDTGLGTS
jgi:hypothetical protein